MQVRLINDQLLLEPVERKDQDRTEVYTDTGLVVTRAEEKVRPNMWGKVLGVGPGAKDNYGQHQPVQVHLNDLVSFSEYEKQEVFIDDVLHFVVAESGVHVVIIE